MCRLHYWQYRFCPVEAHPSLHQVPLDKPRWPCQEKIFNLPCDLRGPFPAWNSGKPVCDNCSPLYSDDEYNLMLNASPFKKNGPPYTGPRRVADRALLPIEKPFPCLFCPEKLTARHLRVRHVSIWHKNAFRNDQAESRLLAPAPASDQQNSPYDYPQQQNVYQQQPQYTDQYARNQPGQDPRNQYSSQPTYARGPVESQSRSAFDRPAQTQGISGIQTGLQERGRSPDTFSSQLTYARGPSVSRSAFDRPAQTQGISGIQTGSQERGRSPETFSSLPDRSRPIPAPTIAASSGRKDWSSILDDADKAPQGRLNNPRGGSPAPRGRAQNAPPPSTLAQARTRRTGTGMSIEDMLNTGTPAGGTSAGRPRPRSNSRSGSDSPTKDLRGESPAPRGRAQNTPPPSASDQARLRRTGTGMSIEGMLSTGTPARRPRPQSSSRSGSDSPTKDTPSPPGFLKSILNPQDKHKKDPKDKKSPKGKEPSQSKKPKRGP